MKVLISSIIRAFSEYRDAAVRGIAALGHQPRRSEDYGATPGTPQQLCLEGVRDSDAVVVILGKVYGDKQPGGLSATHEEFREARERRPTFVFVQSGATADPDQIKLIDEARAWTTGLMTADFSTPDDLQSSVTKALHDWELASVKPVDPAEMLGRARTALAEALSDWNPHGKLIAIAIAVGPRQEILRPGQLEAPDLGEWLQREAQFGRVRLFLQRANADLKVSGHTLTLSQPSALISIDELGTVLAIQPTEEERPRTDPLSMFIIEEEIEERTEQSLRYLGAVLQRIDDVRRLTDIVPVATVLNARHTEWRTRAEDQQRGRSSGIPSMEVSDKLEVKLGPTRIARSALAQAPERLANDFMVLLRREWKKR